MTSLTEKFGDCVREWGGNDAVIHADSVVTFSQIDRLSDRVAAALAERGIAGSDRIALYSINSAEFAIAYLGILKAGATVVPVNLMLKAGEIEYILDDAGVAAMIYHHCVATTALDLCERLQLKFSVGISVEDQSVLSWEQFLETDADPPAPAIDCERDLAAILYTSGTTGRPRGAMLSHANLSANVRSVQLALQIRPGVDRIFVVLPMFHAFAATVGMLTPLLSGCAFVPEVRFEPQAVAAAIKRSQSTIFLGVPSMYCLLLRLRQDGVEMFRSLRLCVSGGAALPVEVHREFEQRFGVPVYEGDGPTECSPVTCLNPLSGPRKPGTVGVPVDGVEMKIVDDQGGALETGAIGEIAVRGASVMVGYLHQPQATAEVMRDGWYLTGDLGFVDKDGYFTIVDRKKDLIIVNGMNVYPRMVEEVMYAMDGITEVAVIGEAHRTHGEIPVAYVVADPAAALTEAEIRAWCRDNLGAHQLPRKFFLVQALPKTASGKILKRELSRQGEHERGVDL